MLQTENKNARDVKYFVRSRDAQAAQTASISAPNSDPNSSANLAGNASQNSNEINQKMKSSDEMRVFVHPRSVNFSTTHYPCPWLTYVFSDPSTLHCPLSTLLFVSSSSFILPWLCLLNVMIYIHISYIYICTFQPVVVIYICMYVCMYIGTYTSNRRPSYSFKTAAASVHMQF